MRLLQYVLVLMVIFGALAYIAPNVASESVRADTVATALPQKLSKADKQRKAGESFWSEPFPIVEIAFEPEEWEYLHRDNRRYCRATLIEGEKTYKDVALKLKGAAGSFQGPDGKPGLTLNFDYYKRAEPFHGLRKVHFNNGVQDGTFLHEQIAGEMARKAGVPASRCSHALVKFHGRDLGLYVVKEAFTKEFLAAFYKNVDGDLYDGGLCREIEENMEKDQGDPKEKAALKELMAACHEGDNAKRWERLGAILDLDLFASYCAMEAILCHWDGYSFNRNNYRLYQDPSTGKFSFFLHGMDQTFGDVNFPLMRDFGAMVSGAYMRCPQGKELYKAKLDSIYANVLKPIDWGARVTEVGEKLREFLEKKNPQWAKDYAGHISAVRQQVTQRIMNVGRMLGDVPKPPSFGPDNTLKLTDGWNPENGAGGDVVMGEAQVDGKRCFHLRANSASAGSWRKLVNLPPGKYRFEARVKTAGVQATDDAKNRGAALRISGGVKGTDFADGDSNWKQIAYTIESQGTDVMLVAELRAQKGEAWFECDSLRLVWMK
jgi:hypothetical protein